MSSIKKKDWVRVRLPVPGMPKQRKLVLMYYAVEHVYTATRVPAGRRERYNVFAIPTEGVAIPIRLGIELPLGHCGHVVEKHILAVLEWGQDAVAVKALVRILPDAHLAAELQEEAVPDGVLADE